ncbi:unnamed protein product [Auanema sp. JU1783]|nr:unnamed protein product [Auanema sp. JU1783]
MLRKFVVSGQRCLATRLYSAAPAAASSGQINKEALMKLRKKTGYSFINCRKALLEFGPDRLDEAEKWLKELAQKEGWAKAVKLSARETTQGLVGVAASGPTAAILELSCETDFVARGDNFKSLLEQITASALKASSSRIASRDASKITQISFDMKDLKNSEGKTLDEVVALSVGKLGENIAVKKAQILVAPEGASLYCSSHPKEGTESVSMGRFVSVVALSRAEKKGLFPTEKLANQLCQHIIGMRSESVGQPPAEKSTQKQSSSAEEGKDKDELNDFFQGQTTHIDEDETTLLRQAFMLNPSQTVHEYLTGHEAKVLDFVRVQLGGEKDE